MNEKGARALQQGHCWKQGKRWSPLLLQMPSPLPCPSNRDTKLPEQEANFSFVLTQLQAPLALFAMWQAPLSRSLVVPGPQVCRTRTTKKIQKTAKRHLTHVPSWIKVCAFSSKEQVQAIIMQSFGKR